MNEIPIEVAQERLVARLIKVLRAKVASEAAALNSARSSPLPLHEITPQAVWRLGAEGDIAETLKASGIGIFLIPDGAAELTEARTGSAQAFGRLDASTWRVLCLFQRVGAYEPQVVDGVELRPSEVMFQMALLYKSAILLALLKYATDSDAVHEVKPLDTYAAYTPNDNAELTGQAVITVEITQNVLLPQPIWGAV